MRRRYYKHVSRKWNGKNRENFKIVSSIIILLIDVKLNQDYQEYPNKSE